jgi:hypothetical protein
MNYPKIFTNIFASVFIAGILFSFVPIEYARALDQCHDGIDNDGDKRADQFGTGQYRPDPACFSDTDKIDTSETSVTKSKDSVLSTIIPCNNYCTFDDVFRLINNLIEFALKDLLIPLFVFMIMYAGYSYITAMGNESKIVKLKSLFMHMIGGLVLVLCSWLIVKGILYALGYTDGLLFFQ